MANVYEVKLVNGNTFMVTTHEHHDNHSMERFKQILFEVLKGTAGGAASGLTSAAVTLFIFKGKK